MILFNTVSQPVETHVGGFGTLLFAVFVHDVCSSGVICDDACCTLFVAELFEGSSDWKCFATVDVAFSNFGLCRGGHDIFEDGRYSK